MFLSALPHLSSSSVLFQTDAVSNHHYVLGLSALVHPSLPALLYTLDCRSLHQRHHRCPVLSPWLPLSSWSSQKHHCHCRWRCQASGCPHRHLQFDPRCGEAGSGEEDEKEDVQQSEPEGYRSNRDENNKNVVVCLCPFHHPDAARDSVNSGELLSSWVRA